MSRDRSPCWGCTPETGRGPGCHNKDCPRGWYEWDQKQQERRAERALAARCVPAGGKRRFKK